ncbi:hypothetical protein ZIOFF_034789 [Zingiber officinale]|uniref:Uncharacterized protein n=1 Tax=Zingiber officinale TaxID=94328 RepID=A0A8J5KX16_ZINOF|nr:hypothetical protein ZIOFF_034789 [Zingiber officinale]
MEAKEDDGGGSGARVWDCGSPLYDSSELASLLHIIDRHTMTLPNHSKNSAGAQMQMVVSGDVAETEKKTTTTTTTKAKAVSKIRKGLGEVFDCIPFRRIP